MDVISLGRDIWLTIMDHMEVLSVVHCRKSCSTFKRWFNDIELWKRFRDHLKDDFLVWDENEEAIREHLDKRRAFLRCQIDRVEDVDESFKRDFISTQNTMVDRISRIYPAYDKSGQKTYRLPPRFGDLFAGTNFFVMEQDECFKVYNESLVPFMEVKGELESVNGKTICYRLEGPWPVILKIWMNEKGTYSYSTTIIAARIFKYPTIGLQKTRVLQAFSDILVFHDVDGSLCYQIAGQFRIRELIPRRRKSREEVVDVKTIFRCDRSLYCLLQEKGRFSMVRWTIEQDSTLTHQDVRHLYGKFVIETKLQSGLLFCIAVEDTHVPLEKEVDHSIVYFDLVRFEWKENSFAVPSRRKPVRFLSDTSLFCYELGVSLVPTE